MGIEPVLDDIEVERRHPDNAKVMDLAVDLMKLKILCYILLCLMLSTGVLAYMEDKHDNKAYFNIGGRELNAEVFTQGENILDSKNVGQYMERLQVRQVARLQNMEQLKITETEEGKVFTEGREEARFLGLFKMQRRYTYEITEEGELLQQRRFWDFMFRKSEVKVSCIKVYEFGEPKGDSCRSLGSNYFCVTEVTKFDVIDSSRAELKGYCRKSSGTSFF